MKLFLSSALFISASSVSATNAGTKANLSPIAIAFCRYGCSIVHKDNPDELEACESDCGDINDATTKNTEGLRGAGKPNDLTADVGILHSTNEGYELTSSVEFNDCARECAYSPYNVSTDDIVYCIHNFCYNDQANVAKEDIPVVSSTGEAGNVSECIRKCYDMYSSISGIYACLLYQCSLGKDDSKHAKANVAKEDIPLVSSTSEAGNVSECIRKCYDMYSSVSGIYACLLYRCSLGEDGSKHAKESAFVSIGDASDIDDCELNCYAATRSRAEAQTCIDIVCS